MRIVSCNPEAGHEPKHPVTILGLKLRDGVVVEIGASLKVNVQSTGGLELATTATVILASSKTGSRVEIPCDSVIVDRAFLGGLAIDLASFAVTVHDNVARTYQAVIAQLLQEGAHVIIESIDVPDEFPHEVLVIVECRGQVFTGRTAWDNVENHLDVADR